MKDDAPDDPYQKIKNILVVSVSMNCKKKICYSAREAIHR